MAVGGEDTSKKNLRPENKFTRDYMKYDNFVVLIRNDSAEIWVFEYSITLGLGTKKKASTGVLSL
jgi:hypothetical protein